MRVDSLPKQWPAQNPDRIQLYSLATPNGKKASILLEELEIPYEAHRINIMEGDQHHEQYVKINPNSKIPAIIDPDGPGGSPLAIMESGALMIYLADKAGKLLPRAGAERSEVLQWLFFQVGSVGPMFGQFGHFFKFAKGKTDGYGEERYGEEVTRLLKVMDDQLEGKEWIAGDYSIADIALIPWVDALDFYGGKEAVGYADFKNVQAWSQRFNAREAVKRGIQVCGF